MCCFFFKQKTAYEMRISDGSSDVCSTDLPPPQPRPASRIPRQCIIDPLCSPRNMSSLRARVMPVYTSSRDSTRLSCAGSSSHTSSNSEPWALCTVMRSEEHTSELQSLMRISYAVFCLKKKTKDKQNNNSTTSTYT